MESKSLSFVVSLLFQRNNTLLLRITKFSSGIIYSTNHSFQSCRCFVMEITPCLCEVIRNE
jgi:hypothetical protein